MTSNFLKFELNKEYPLNLCGELFFRLLNIYAPAIIENIPAPTKAEIENLQSGNVEIALVEKKNILFFCIKCGNLVWGDTPFHINFAHPYDKKEIKQGLNEIEFEKNHGFGLTIHLIDSIDNKLKVNRVIGLGDQISNRLKEIILKQCTSFYDTESFNKDCYEIYQKYTTNDLVAIAKKNGDYFSLK